MIRTALKRKAGAPPTIEGTAPLMRTKRILNRPKSAVMTQRTKRIPNLARSRAEYAATMIRTSTVKATIGHCEERKRSQNRGGRWRLRLAEQLHCWLWRRDW